MIDSSLSHIEFDDGHKPGGTETQTMLAVHSQKESKGFVSIFDDLLDLVWRERVYMYSLTKKKPWGESLVCSSRSS